MSEMGKINTTLTDVFKNTPIGDIDRAMGLTFHGINHRQTHNPVPINTDGYGLVFFTRPQLNFGDGNLRAERKLLPLMTKAPASIQRIIRCYLDPRLQYLKIGIDCPFVDEFNPFIPLLTNHCLSTSGWPDPVHDTYTSKPGAYKEEFGYVNSNLDNYGAFQINATFRNMQGDPINALFRAWTIYQANVFEGIMVPYPDFIAWNIIDYNTRIYRLVLDKSKRFIQKIACTGAAFPLSQPIGHAFDFDSSKPINSSMDQIQIPFRCFGVRYNDPIIMHNFNRAVQIFNPAMRPNLRPSLMREVGMAELSYFNNQGYPYIDMETSELKWFVDANSYNTQLNSMQRHQAALSEPPILPLIDQTAGTAI